MNQKAFEKETALAQTAELDMYDSQRNDGELA